MNGHADRKTKSKFVWGAVSGVNCYCRFLQTFEAGKTGRYILRISADSNYTVWLNGQYVGAFQYPDYPQYKFFDCYDVSAMIREGTNTLAVLGYCLNESSSVYRRGTPAVIFSVCCDKDELCFSGRETFWSPETAYLSGPDCEKFSGQLSYGFEYDATRQEDWINPNYRRGNWQRCVPLNQWMDLHERPIERPEVLEPAPARIVAQGVFREDENIASRALRMQRSYLSAREFRAMASDTDNRMPSAKGIRLNGEGEPVYAVIDLGKETAGWLCLDLEADYGTRIDIGFGEHLEDLRVRSWVGGRCFAVGYTATQGRQKFIHRMKRIGCRYLQLHIHGHAVLHYAGLLPTVYPVKESGTLRFGDRLHERIYRTCLDTMRLCMHEHYEDCPWREQALYAMDSRNQMLFGYYAFGERLFARSSLWLLAKGMREDGLLELCAPAEVPVTIPAFSLHFVCALWEHLLFCGDRAFALEMLPVAVRILETFEKRIEPCGLIARFQGKEYWNFYEWADGLEGSLGQDEQEHVFDLPLNAFYSMALRAAHMLCYELGDERAKHFSELRQMVNKAISSLFWDRASCLFCTFYDGEKKYHFSELAQSLAICCGAADEVKQGFVLPTLASRNGALVPVTLACSIYRYDALMVRPAVYSRQVFDEVAEIWGGMLFSGATSFWETAKGAEDFDCAGSLCHGWSAVPVYLYYRYALGVCPALAGFSGYKFAPVDCGFEISGEFSAGKKKFLISPDEKGALTLKIVEKK